MEELTVEVIAAVVLALINLIVFWRLSWNIYDFKTMYYIVNKKTIDVARRKAAED